MRDGKVLEIDLTTRKVEVTRLNEKYRELYLGGIGMAVRLLMDHSTAGTDPFSPSNPLVFAAGSFTGTMVPTASKHAVATKSPLTGFIGDSLSSSGWSLALRRAGLDGMVITGRAPELTYLYVEDGRVYFRKAAKLAGKGCYETEEAVRQDLGDGSVRVSSIGPAGESLVRYACMGNDYSRQAGRTGVGAVMGSKNLKAIAIKGTRRVEAADVKSLDQLCLNLYKTAQGASTEKYRVLGTPANILTLNRLAALPTRNFQESTFEFAEEISGERLVEQHLERVVACTGCAIGCDHIYNVKEGKYAGTKAQLDYETLFALGSLCGVSDLAAILKAADLCDHYGVDSISAGVSVAWAMESFQRGVLTLDDTDGLDLSFGNDDALIATIEAIGTRKGLGRLLGEGVKRASAEVGKGSDHWAMHSKGLEFPGYEPRSLQTLALGYATGTRGACHNRSAAYEVDMSGKVDRFKGERNRGPMAMAQEDFAAVLDSLGICKFLRKCFKDFYAETAELFTAVHGIPMSADDVKRVGERVSTLKKAFNIREGWTRADDWLPPRVFRDPLPNGVAQGVSVSEAELTEMIDGYYEARGWTAGGLIPAEKLQQLGLDDLVETEGEARDGVQVYSLRS